MLELIRREFAIKIAYLKLRKKMLEAKGPGGIQSKDPASPTVIYCTDIILHHRA